ncbi:MAG TPA: hypothetical protein VEO18_00440 [Thermoplasmata archaeon]|nr:hypothetical protein [Thermoplasmata archaeon]
MTKEQFKQRRKELERELERFLKESERDPKIVKMLVSLQGD